MSVKMHAPAVFRRGGRDSRAGCAATGADRGAGGGNGMSVKPVQCDRCRRMTLTYNVDEQNRKLCPVCITELQDRKEPQVGPSEVKDIA